MSEDQKAYLVLADGTCFEGNAFGAQDVEVSGELVFSTAMTGYVELLTDPSYHGQILTLTCPEIGNYGVQKEDMESDRVHARALVVKELSPVVSNWRSKISLDDWLKEEKIPGIYGIDTRALVMHLRSVGSMMSILSTRKNDSVEALYAKAKKLKGMQGQELASEVTTKKVYAFKSGRLDLNGKELEGRKKTKYQVVVLDFGVKLNILRLLVDYGCNVTVVPASTLAEDILKLNPDGLFLSNGPGDPATMNTPVATVKELLGRLPIFGICMGHQILSLALGETTFKLKFGHRGANQPVMAADRRVRITSQNHGFAVLTNESNSKSVNCINLSDGTVEGVQSLNNWAFSVQYHPEGAPGPRDAEVHFGQFVDLMERWKNFVPQSVLEQENSSVSEAVK